MSHVYLIVEILQNIYVLATKISYTPQAVGSSNQTIVHPMLLIQYHTLTVQLNL